MYDVRPVTHTRRYGRCGKLVVTTGICGPSLICGACAERLLAVIWGGNWPAMKAHLAGLGTFSYPGSEVPTDQRNRPSPRSRYSARTGRR